VGGPGREVDRVPTGWDRAHMRLCPHVMSGAGDPWPGTFPGQPRPCCIALGVPSGWSHIGKGACDTPAVVAASRLPHGRAAAASASRGSSDRAAAAMSCRVRRASSHAGSRATAMCRCRSARGYAVRGVGLGSGVRGGFMATGSVGVATGVITGLAGC
jgi:hypothetical protein